MVLSGRGTEQQSKGVDSVLAFINLMLALGKVGKPASGYGTSDRSGQRTGRPRAWPEGGSAARLSTHRGGRPPRGGRRVWGIDPATLPRKGRSAYELLDSLGRPGGCGVCS